MLLGLGLSGFAILGGGSQTLTQQVVAMFRNGEQGFIYDFSDPLYVFQERTGASATTQSGPDGPIGTVKDKSPNNNYATAPSDAARPIWRPTGFAEFDGSNDSLVSTFTIAQPIVRISSWRPVTGSLDNGDYVYGGVSALAAVLNAPTAGAYQIYSGTALGTVSIAADEDVVTIERHQGATSRFGKNDEAYLTGNAGTGVPGGVRIATNNSASAFISLRQYRVLEINRDLTDDEIATVKAWCLEGAPLLLSRLQNGLVDFVGIGDSNQIHNGDGFDHGWQYALDNAGYSMYATGLITQNENGGSGASQGYLYNRAGTLTGAVSGAPAGVGKYLDKGAGGLFPADYTYVADGNTVAASAQQGLLLNATCPLDVTAALDFDIHWRGFDSGAGSFRPTVRIEQAPFTNLTVNGTVSTNTGTLGSDQTTTVSISADAGRSGIPISGKLLYSGVQGITGPFFMTYMRFRNPAVTTGWSYGTLDFRGGQSARTAAYDLQQASDETLTHYFGILRNDQGAGQKTIAIIVNEGINDRNETLASVGPATATPGDSPSAFVDNVTAIVKRIQNIWSLNGWAANELFFILLVSHPISTPDDAELISYRSALLTYVVSKGSYFKTINMNTLIGSATITTNSWYYSDGTNNHLTQAGYEGVTSTILPYLL